MDFYPSTARTYEICAVMEGCPPETNYCQTFVVTEDCFELLNLNPIKYDHKINLFPAITSSSFTISGLQNQYVILVIDQTGTLISTLESASEDQ